MVRNDIDIEKNGAKNLRDAGMRLLGKEHFHLSLARVAS